MKNDKSNSLLVIIIGFILLSIVVVALPFWLYFYSSLNTKKKTHCNNSITIGIIVNIENIQNVTIITLENKGVMKKEVVDNYYYDIYQVNDSIIHCK